MVSVRSSLIVALLGITLTGGLMGCSSTNLPAPNAAVPTPTNGVYNDMPVPETLIDINSIASSGIRSPFNNLLEPKEETKPDQPNQPNAPKADVPPPSDPLPA